MNCEECKERIFELIEREAVDPEGVRAILERCPDCRAEFDATKAALAVAEQLPIEQPPAELDRAILEAAQQRAQPKVVPLRRRLLQAPPWAMAAIALLAVGVGVWSIPRTVEFEGDRTVAPDVKEAAKLEDAVATVAESEPPAGADAEQARGLEIEAAEDRAAPAEPSASAKTGNELAAPKASRAKRQRAAAPKPARVEADLAEAEAAAPAAAPAVVAQESQVAARRVARDAADGRAEAYAGKKAEPAVGGAAMEAAGAADELDSSAAERATCKTKVTAFETRLRENESYEPKPEEELAMGRCYQTLGDAKNARTWLERAAKHRSTRKRANEALRGLGPK